MAPSVAAAQSKAQCVAAYKEGQVRRKDGELLAARSSFQVCAATSCPPVLRRDCAPWLDQVSAAIPTLAVRVTATDAKSLTAVKLFVDGQSVAAPPPGGVLELDPGAHLLRAEADGHEPSEQAVKVRAGEKNVAILLALTPTMLLKSEAPPIRPIPAGAIAFTAIGLAGVGAFATFGLLGDAARSELEACKPACAPSRVDEVKRDYVIADVSLGVGVLFLGLATYSFLTRPEVPSAALVPTVRIQAGAHGAGVSIASTF